MKHILVLGIVGVIILALGCATTRTLPDGTVEETRLDPVALAALTEITQAVTAIAIARAESRTVEEPDMSTLSQLVALLPDELREDALAAIEAAEAGDAAAILAALIELQKAANTG